jgi:hypothetical protein
MSHNQYTPLKVPRSKSFLKTKSYCAKSREELLDDSPEIQ